MIFIRALRTSVLGVLFLFFTPFITPAIPNVYTVVSFVKHRSKQLAMTLGLTRKSIGTVNILNDVEADLEYILQVRSLRELTDNLTVYINGVPLVPDEVTPVSLKNASCNFSFEFPLAAFLKLLQQKKMQTLVTTYKEQIELYIQNNVRPCLQQLHARYGATRLFQALIGMLKVRISFVYTVTQEDLKKECVSLLALVLRKRVELNNASKKGNTCFATTYSPLRTLNIHITL